MTGLQVRILRTRMNLTLAQFALLVGVNMTTVYRWEGHLTGQVPAMVESTRRVFLMLQGATQSERTRWAQTLLDHGWQAAWAQMFYRESFSKPARTKEKGLRAR